MSARYVTWADAASDVKAEQYWLNESYRIGGEVRSVDSRSTSAIEAKRVELRTQLANMPVEAPALPCPGSSHRPTSKVASKDG